jgi:sortase A
MNREREIALGVECAWAPLPEPRRSSWLWVVFIALLVALGTWELGRGALIQAKAWLAQGLIAHAWARTLTGERQAKPWPWADTWPVARLTVPRLGIERYVLAGADGAAMAFGPGHVSGTPLPGEAGNSVIGGHRDTHLAFLAKLKPGDMLIAERADGRRVTYRVSAMEVLDRREVWVTKQEGPARLTLLTCYPFDAWRASSSQRYVLVAFLS